jgi:hypothetical protein
VEHLLTNELQALAHARQQSAPARWDGKDVSAFSGTYGDYLLQKVSKVFPDLAELTLAKKARL